MCKQALDLYDMRPQSQIAYLSNFGWHFTEKLCRFAVSCMYYKEGDKEKEVEYIPKEKVEELLTKHGIKLQKKINHDFVYLYHMYCSDLKGKAPVDEKMILFIAKAIFEDDDAADGFILRRWYATMVGNGEPIYWSDFLDDTE